jgi:hypothetical protein
MFDSLGRSRETLALRQRQVKEVTRRTIPRRIERTQARNGDIIYLNKLWLGPSSSTSRPITSAWTTRRAGVRYKNGFPYVGAVLGTYPADRGNSANVVGTAQDSLGTIIRTKCLYPFSIPWRTGRREVVSLARAFGMTIRHGSGLPEGDRGPLFPDWCIEPPDGARLESGLGSCLQFGQRWPAEHLRPVLRPPTYPPKWGRMGRNQRSSETLVY